MTDVNKEIELALLDRVDTIVLTPVLSVAYPDVTFTPPNDNKYLEIIHIPNDVDNYAWDNEDAEIYKGLLNINIHWSGNVGNVPVKNIADNIINNYFSKGTILTQGSTKVHIYKKPSVSAPIKNGAYRFVTVKISYQTMI